MWNKPNVRDYGLLALLVASSKLVRKLKGTVEMIDWGGSGVGYSFIIINH